MGGKQVQIALKTLTEWANTLRRLGEEMLEIIRQDSEEEPVGPGEVAPDVLYLARAIQGEGAALFGDCRDEVGLWIGHTAMNRMAKPWWPDTMVGVVSSAFHGYVNVLRPARWAVHLAQQAMERDEDLAEGALFMLSGKDLEDHGWSSSSAHQAFVSDGNEFYFFRTWPGG